MWGSVFTYSYSPAPLEKILQININLVNKKKNSDVQNIKSKSASDEWFIMIYLDNVDGVRRCY